MTKIGKRVVDDFYVHLSARDHLDESEPRRKIEEALQRLQTLSGPAPVVAKLNLRTGRLSFLSNIDFDENRFLELAASCTRARTGTRRSLSSMAQSQCSVLCGTIYCVCMPARPSGCAPGEFMSASFWREELRQVPRCRTVREAAAGRQRSAHNQVRDGRLCGSWRT